MAIDPEAGIRSQVHSLVEELSGILPEALVRQDDLGTELSFQSGLIDFQRISRVIQLLRKSDLTIFPANRLSQLISTLSEIRNRFAEITKFSAAKTSDPARQRDQIVVMIRSHSEAPLPRTAFDLLRACRR